MTAEKRKITFHGRVQFKKIRHVSEFSEDEIRNGWYDTDDFAQMSDNVSEIAALVGKGKKSLNGEELCLRGLEHIIEEELADYRAEKMINSIDAVLDEQEQQWDDGIEDQEAIAKLYAEFGKGLLEEAHQLGLEDAKEGYKTWDELFQESPHQRIRKGKTKSKKKETRKAKKKKKVKKEKKEKREQIDESEKVSPTSLPDRSPLLSQLSMESLIAPPPRSRASKLGNDNSIMLSSLQEESSFLLQDSDSMLLQADVEVVNDGEKKRRKYQPRRTMADRRNGSEASPFVIRRDGTLRFKRPEEERKLREQKQKRKFEISKSMSAALDFDDDDDDILAGILSSKSSKSKPRKSSKGSSKGLSRGSRYR